MNKKFEYFLNVIHYNIYLEEVWTNRKIDGIVRHIYFLIVSSLFTKRMRFKLYRRYLQSRPDVNEYTYGQDFGLSIGVAHHLFGTFYSCFPCFLSFVLLGFVFRFCDRVSDFVIILTMAIPVGISYILAYKAVFTQDRYLKYFEQFKKEDAEWHRRWKKVTVAFCISSIIIALLGIGAMWGILLYR